MSLQDDYFDLDNEIKDPELRKAFEHIWFAFCFLEGKECVDLQLMPKSFFIEWAKAQIKELEDADEKYCS